MIQIVLFSLFLSFANLLAAEKKVVLMTSLDNWGLEAKLERIFRKKLRRYPFEILVRHRSDQETLYRALNDEKVDAVFWVSHGAFSDSGGTSNSPGMSPVNMILDHNQDNVAPVFQKIHPNIEYLGIIGCNSKQILESYKMNEKWNLSEDVPPLQYVSSRKSIARYALRRAIRRFKKAYRRNNLPAQNLSVIRQGYPVEIKRSIVGDSEKVFAKPLRIMNKGRLLGVLPVPKRGVTVSTTVYIPEKERFDRSSLTLEINSGESVNRSVNDHAFGKLEVVGPYSNFRWKLFSKPDGKPFGVNKRIFLYEGDRAIMNSSRSYKLFK